MIFHLFIHASVFVQIIVLLLICLSIASWSIIFFKFKLFRHIDQLDDSFCDTFYEKNDLFLTYNSDMTAHKNAPTRSLFANLITQYIKLKNQKIDNIDCIINQLNDTIAKKISYEGLNYNNRLSFLATIGSVSPYIGLLGTVWGILDAFISIASNKAADSMLSIVAPGIAESLVTTAIGLFVAIPAYVFYNHYTTKINDRLIILENFATDIVAKITEDWYTNR